MMVVKRLSLPVAAGGAGAYFGLTFSDVDEDLMFMRIRQVGTLPNLPITLSKPISLTEVKSPLEGNIVVVKGQKGSGSYPKEPALWRSLIEEFENLPLWDSTVTYKRDRYVRYNDAIYQARNNHSNSNITPAAGSSWNVIKFKDYIEDYTGNTDFNIPLGLTTKTVYGKIGAVMQVLTQAIVFWLTMCHLVQMYMIHYVFPITI